MSICILNQSTVVTSESVELWRDAIGRQIRYHVSEGWHVECPNIYVVSTLDEVWPEDRLVVILDNSDQAESLGYHSQTPSGVEYARVFAATSIEHDVPVSVVLSHEICEMVVDGDCNRWALDNHRRLWAVEICDPCESSWYTMDGTDVLVSDFVKPSFFDPSSTADTVVTHLGGTGGFTVQQGGYAVIWRPRRGRPEEVFGEHYPDWKRHDKQFAAARTARREKADA